MQRVLRYNCCSTYGCYNAEMCFIITNTQNLRISQFIRKYAVKLWCCIMSTSILTLIRPVMLLVFSVAILSELIPTSGEGNVSVLPWDVMSSGSVGCPSHPVAILLGLRFSRFLNFHFLDYFGAEPQIFLWQPTSCRVHSVSFSSMIIPALSLSLHMFYVIILMKVPLATRLQFPSCTCCFVYGALHYGGCLLLHLI